MPIFYLHVGRSIRLGICVSRYKLINGEKLSCHGELYYLQCAKPNVLVFWRIIVNGQPVWFVAVCVRAGEFFASPGKRCEVVTSR